MPTFSAWVHGASSFLMLHHIFLAHPEPMQLIHISVTHQLYQFFTLTSSGTIFCLLLQNVWDPKPSVHLQRHTTDNQPLATYPSLCTPQGLTHYPSLSSQTLQGIWGSPARSRPPPTILPGLDGEGSSEFAPGSLSSAAEDSVWAGKQTSGLRSMRSVDISMPIGSSPERVRLMQGDYHIRESER